MFIVYSVGRAGNPFLINVAELGKPMPTDTRGGIATLLHAFQTAPEADAYCQQLRTYFNLHGARVNHYKHSAVFCETTGREFRSISDAAEANGVSRTLISRHINNPQRFPHARGMKFYKVNEEAL